MSYLLLSIYYIKTINNISEGDTGKIIRFLGEEGNLYTYTYPLKTIPSGVYVLQKQKKV